jgi:hypothetical protein
MRAFLVFLGLVLLVAVGWVWLTLTWSYSEGERAGFVAAVQAYRSHRAGMKP